VLRDGLEGVRVLVVGVVVRRRLILAQLHARSHDFEGLFVIALRIGGGGRRGRDVL
jgi:hypothetical protein